MIKFDWTEDAVTRLQHHILVGNLSIQEMAEVFGVDNSNLRKVIKRKGLRKEPFPSSFGRKERVIGLQLLKYDLPLTEVKTPHGCEMCGRKLTYDIYGDKDNSATVYIAHDGRYDVLCNGGCDDSH